MGTPLYNTDIIPLTSRPTLTVMDDGDYFVILDTSTGKISKILKTNIMTALKITYDNTSGLTAETVQAALDELVVNLGSSDSAILALAGRLDTLEGTGEGSVAKAIDDAVSPLAEVVDTNRLYSDSQYLDLKAKADSLQVKCNTLQAEVYTDDPILQYGAVEIIGDGYEADDTPIDVSANVVDGSLELEQKGLTIRNLVTNGDFAGGTTGWTGVNATLSEHDNILSVMGDGTSVSPRVETSTTSLLSVNQRNFSKLRVRVTNSDCSSIRLRMRGTLGGTLTVSSVVPTINIWYALSDIMTVTDQTGNLQILIYAIYANSATANGKVMEIDGNYGVSAYNLTALGLDHITDTAILAKLLPYVDGTKNVGKMGLRVVGKNLFDKSKVLMNMRLRSDVAIPHSYANSICSDFIKVTEGTYIFSRNELGSETGTGYVWTYDAQRNPVRNLDYIRGNLDDRQFVIQEGEAYLRFNLFGMTEFVLLDNVRIQLELGTTATAYEPYQEQLTFLPAIGNSLPDGTADSIKTVADGWEHSKRVYTPEAVGSGVAVNTTNYPTAKNGGQWVNELTAGGTEIGVVGTDSTTGAGMLRFELATPIVTKYDLPIPTSGKTIHRFAGEEKIALYGTGLTFSENVLTVLSAIKFVAGVMTDITDLATITGDTVTFSGVSATDVVYVKVEHSVNRPLGILEHTPAVSNTASRLASLEARVSALEV